jgi:hypothetical protein
MTLKLPIGIANFAEIVEGGYIYADKTRLLRELLRERKSYFLSRPRRFGKTLTISSLKAILTGRRDLFKGLWIDGSDYDWTPNPVIHLSLSGIDAESVDTVKSSLLRDLNSIAESDGLKLEDSNPFDGFKSLIEGLRQKHNRPVAVLIDECDAPILKQADNPVLAGAIQGALQTFYGCLKAKEEERGFVFIAGVLKFAPSSLFYDLNDLDDLTLNEEYAEICGFSVKEFDESFATPLENALFKLQTEGFLGPEEKASDLRNSILNWYGGYSWDGVTQILNPWSVLKFFQNRSFEGHWASVADGDALLESLAKASKIDFNFLSGSKSLLASRNILKLGFELEPLPLLFQTGRLSVTRVEKSSGGAEYFLAPPNLEVSERLIPLALKLPPIKYPLTAKEQAKNAFRALFDLDPTGFQSYFTVFMANFYDSSHKVREANCRSLFLAAVLLAEVNVTGEVDPESSDRPILLSSRDGNHFLASIKPCFFGEDLKSSSDRETLKKKMSKKAKNAIRQINAQDLPIPFKSLSQSIYKVGVAILGVSETLVVFEKEKDF